MKLKLLGPVITGFQRYGFARGHNLLGAKQHHEPVLYTRILPKQVQVLSTPSRSHRMLLPS
jgi:hypothetical protein